MERSPNGAGAFIGDAARFAVLLGTTLYGLGVLIVNADLGRYGLFAVDLIRAEYILAGTLWFLVIAVPALIVGGFPFYMGSLKHAPTVGVAAAILAFALPYVVLSFTIPEYRSSHSYVRDMRLQLWILAVAAPNMVSGWILAAILPRIAGSGAALFRGGVVGLFVLIPVLGVLPLYTATVYPAVPRHFGGGKRPIVWVHLKTPSLLEQSGSAALNAEGLRGPLYLILERPEYLIVQPVDRATPRDVIAIPRPDIAAIVFSKP